MTLSKKYVCTLIVSTRTVTSVRICVLCLSTTTTYRYCIASFETLPVCPRPHFLISQYYCNTRELPVQLLTKKKAFQF
jgi:hypothetical protein